MTIDQGMNVAEVQALADALKAASDRLSQHARALEQIVVRAQWVGPVGVRFRTQWWPQHRGSVQTIATELSEFGQVARMNANQQLEASSASGAGASGLPSSGRSGTNPDEDPVDFLMGVYGHLDTLHTAVSLLHGANATSRAMDGWGVLAIGVESRA